MSSLLKILGLGILKYLLRSEAIHDELRKLAKRTDNKLDDAGIEAALALFVRLADLLDGKKEEDES